MRILYPSDYFKPKLPDEQYRDEASAFGGTGVSYSTVNTDELSSANLNPPPIPGEDILYRGWMLNSTSYEQLVAAIEKVEATPITDLVTYLSTHHLPNWYQLLQEFTAETIILPLEADFEGELRSLAWPRFFIKDYVKSLKTSVGSVVSEPSEINVLLQEMEKFRGEIEGGICVRRFEEFQPESECRYFVVRGVPFSPSDSDIPDVVSECAKRIESPFFSVDIAKRSDGVDRVVEIGDGQVSDLVGWSVERFVQVMEG